MVVRESEMFFFNECQALLLALLLLLVLLLLLLLLQVGSG